MGKFDHTIDLGTRRIGAGIGAVLAYMTSGGDKWEDRRKRMLAGAGIGMAAGLEKDSDGLGAVGGYRELNQYTTLGGSLTIFALPGR